jgi:integrase
MTIRRAIPIYRRHVGNCPHKAKGRKWDRCGCPYWADARPQGPLQSLGTSDRAVAISMARDMEENGGGAPSRATVQAPITIAEAKDAFFASLDVTNLSGETKRKHETLWRQVVAFAAGVPDADPPAPKLTLVADMDAAAVARFIKTWEDAPLSRGKKIERFRQFFKFAIERNWIAEDPTKSVKKVKVKTVQTPPFTPNEEAKILVEAERMIREGRTSAKANALRAKALILFLRYSGMRIGDAVSCKIEWVKDGRVRRITTKQGRHIDVKLPPHVIQALATIPPKNDLYWFWSGIGKLETATTTWQNLLAKIFKGAGIVGGHAHRFRDTFAVAMLERGESLQAVADALGDTLAVVQKHYNAWSKIRQARLDEAVSGDWKNDPLLRLLDDQAALAKDKGRRVN